MTGQDIERAVAEAVSRDFAGHRLIVRLDQGLYRHLVFEAKEHSWNDRFELITAPGSLTITGDRGAHTFRRMTDMFQFFRSNGNTYGINPGYWAEKLPDSGRSVKVYGEHKLWENLDEYLPEPVKTYRAERARWSTAFYKGEAKYGDRPELPADLSEVCEVIIDAEEDGDLSHEDGARNLLRELENLDLVSDTWEWDLSDWDYHFLHNLHAIAWGIQQYDRAVKLGLHVRRTGLVAWDTPLPTVAPPAPKPVKQEKTPIKATVTMRTVAVAGGVL